VRALQRQARLLKAHAAALHQGNDDYIGEVAGTLRILVSDAGANQPALLGLMRQFDIEVRPEEAILSIPPRTSGVRIGACRIGARDHVETITWMAGPLEIGWVRLPPPRRSITLEEWLQSFSHLLAGAAGTPEPVTKITFIQALANQYGGAHEDPGIDLHLVYALNMQSRVDGRSAHVAILYAIAERVAWVADRFLERLRESRPDLSETGRPEERLSPGP
jgi:hypothetical protein